MSIWDLGLSGYRVLFGRTAVRKKLFKWGGCEFRERKMSLNPKPWLPGLGSWLVILFESRWLFGSALGETQNVQPLNPKP